MCAFAYCLLLIPHLRRYLIIFCGHKLIDDHPFSVLINLFKGAHSCPNHSAIGLFSRFANGRQMNQTFKKDLSMGHNLLTNAIIFFFFKQNLKEETDTRLIKTRNKHHCFVCTSYARQVTLLWHNKLLNSHCALLPSNEKGSRLATAYLNY